jgi:hypothetical protein
LTASGSLLATASAKGTVLRVWNVATQTCVHEFRRGVERATITCLAFSWDNQWLACCSDKGTAHVFFCNPQKQNDKKPSNNNKASSFTKRLLFQHSETKSVCQIRGIPHPLACAFVGDAVQPNILAVAGWDADGNGVLLQSEFAAHQEARRVAYHVLVKNGVEETEEERRRRRARGWKPSVPNTPDHPFGNLQISEPAMNHLSTNECVDGDEDFCEVLVKAPIQPLIDESQPEVAVVVDDDVVVDEDDDDNDDNSGADKANNNNNLAADTVSGKGSALQDSVRTEPLDDPEPTEEQIFEATQ